MDFQLTEDQEMLVGAIRSIVRDHVEIPQSERFGYCYHDAALRRRLEEGGFLDAARELGPLEAALVIAETARLPATVEVAASTLVAPMLLPNERLPGPIALLSGDALSKAHRNLPIARSAIVDLGDDAAVLRIAPDNVEQVSSIYAFPYGRLKITPDVGEWRQLPGAGPRLRQWWRVAIALEIAAAAQAAIDFTVDYVNQREVFGRPVGAFQAVQHRLVHCHTYATATRYLALRAAWSGDAAHADFAACHAQQGIRNLVFDLHQFHGGMGTTTEHLLHFWTYRVRALQAEAGGVHGAALDIVDLLWNERPAAAAQDAAEFQVGVV